MLQPTLRKFATTCIITLLLTPLLAFNGSWLWNQPSDGSIRLEAPPFFNSAQAQGTTFADNEAGIAAYFNTGSNINLSNATLRSLYRTFDAQTADYLLGSAYISEPDDNDLDYSENDDAKLYVSADGWVMAYYPRAAPTSKIFDWLNWNGSGVVPTKLGQVLRDVASAVGAQQSVDPTYYHFAYPNANRLMLIADDLIVSTINSNSFTFSPPNTNGFSYFEWSYSLAALNNSGTAMTYSLNGNDSGKEAFRGLIFYEKFSGTQPLVGQINTVTLSASSTCCAHGASGLAVIYKVP